MVVSYRVVLEFIRSDIYYFRGCIFWLGFFEYRLVLEGYCSVGKDFYWRENFSFCSGFRVFLFMIGISEYCCVF